MTTTEPEINWAYNCLTGGIHHGRPEAIWNLPLGYATQIYSAAHLEDLVLARIYNDAMQFVKHGGAKYTQDWADRVKAVAKERYLQTLASKIDEITTYYQGRMFHSDMENIVELIERDKLNPHYEPLHPHDTINLLCRILGVGAEIKART
jgi:hypothetical protein